MNRIKRLFNEKKNDILNVYFTAGHPTLDSTSTIISSLEKAGVDIIELGIPYSDPLADGETIQLSSAAALANGMTLRYLIAQVRELRKSSSIPIILMGYYNQMLQYGIESFLADIASAGVDGLIIPDLPMSIYETQYMALFEKLDLAISFLITPETSDERIKQADRLSSAFIYVVSKSSITGNQSDISGRQEEYFNRLASMKLNSPKLIGFGIHDAATYNTACRYANGAIIGSAFIRELDKSNTLNLATHIESFIKTIR